MMKHFTSFFRAAAISNWIFGGSTIFHRIVFLLLGLEPVRYPTLFIFIGMLAVALGAMYWDIAQEPKGSRSLLKIGLLCKAGGSFIWTVGLLTQELPRMFWIFAIWMNYFWLPGFVYYYFLLRKGGDKNAR